MTRANLLSLAFAPPTDISTGGIVLDDLDLVGTPMSIWGITAAQSYRLNAVEDVTIQWSETTTNFVPGETYTFSLYVRSDRPGTAHMSVGFGSGSFLNGQTTAVGEAWARVSVSAVFPTDASTVTYRLHADDVGAGARLDVVGKMAEQGDEAGPFFNGDGSEDPNLITFWTGTERLSASLAEESFVPRGNLVRNPSFIGGLTTGWSPIGGASLQTQSAGGVSGDHFVYLNHGQRTEGVGLEYQSVPVQPLLPYAASAYAIVPRLPLSAAGLLLTIRLTWRDSAGVILREDTAQPSTIERGGDWERISVVGYAPPRSATVSLSIFRPDSPPLANSYVGIDAVMLEQRRHVLGFVDSDANEVQIHTINRAFSPYHTTGGLELRGDIMLDNLVLNTIDEQGTTWVCTDIDGWWTLSSPEFPQFDRYDQDGEHEVTGRYQARDMILTGVFVPKKPGDVAGPRDRLVRAADLVRRGAWLRSSEDPTKAAWVRLNGRPDIRTVNARGRTEFAIPLRAADPLRYGWNDIDPQGLTRISSPGDSLAVQNDGTAKVSAIFRALGPLGAGTSITNEANGESLQISRPLRGDAPVATVLRRALKDGIATLYTSAPPNLSPGDQIIVTGLGAPFDTVRTPYEVIATNSVDPMIVTYRPEVGEVDVPTGSARGFISLAEPDTLEVDTHERSVSLNGFSYGYRNMLRTNTLWPWLEPGHNQIVLSDTAANLPIKARYIDYRTKQVSLVTESAHFLRKDEEVVVEIAETAPIVQREIENKIATLTTEEKHGFIVGDVIDVDAETVGEIRTKAVTANVATIGTESGVTYSTGDRVTVAMPITAKIVRKGVVSNIATITTSSAHGYSNGDLVTVTLPTSATATKKSATASVATITTATAHGFSVGDTVTIPLPSNLEMSSKSYRNGIVTLTATAAHGLAVGDTITVTLPGDVATTGARTNSGTGSQLSTISTSSPSRYSVGDMIHLDLGYPTAQTVSAKTQGATTSTLTIGTPTSGWLVGDVVRTLDADGLVIEQGPIQTLTSTSIVLVPIIRDTRAVASVENVTLREAFTGNKILTAVSDTGLTFFGGWTAQYTLSGTPSAAPNGTIENVTNDRMRGTHTVASSPSSTVLTYRSN